MLIDGIFQASCFVINVAVRTTWLTVRQWDNFVEGLGK